MNTIIISNTGELKAWMQSQMLNFNVRDKCTKIQLVQGEFFDQSIRYYVELSYNSNPLAQCFVTDEYAEFIMKTQKASVIH
ncbi:hypothetical protein [Photobacterium leiognathi]|uniref:hypothetical protein n=1 Tax=Photobacterium leiognathi TaxID=553611 RepID=UPI002980DDDF|nr:hypothetical protein [Photobacterium leiognathi]